MFLSSFLKSFPDSVRQDVYWCVSGQCFLSIDHYDSYNGMAGPMFKPIKQLFHLCLIRSNESKLHKYSTT